jgi:hypothetical protein
MIYLLAATAPMYFESITYFCSKEKEDGVAAFLNACIENEEEPTDLCFVVKSIQENIHTSIIMKQFNLGGL